MEERQIIGLSKEKLKLSSLEQFSSRISIVLLCVTLVAISPEGCAANVRQRLPWLEPDARYKSGLQVEAVEFDAATTLSPFTALAELHTDLARRVLQGSSELLAVRNDRVDPLDHLRKYRGGYDIKGKHYWASTIFTGIYGYAIAAAWLLAGVVLAFVGWIYYCCRSKPSGKGRPYPSKTQYRWAPFLVMVVLASLVIASCAVLYVGNKHFHSRAKKVENTIIEAANNATKTIHNVTSTMTSMETELQPYDGSLANDISSIIAELNREANLLHRRVHDIKGPIDTGLQVLYISVITIAAINLVIVVLALVCILLHWRRFFYLIVVLLWILIAIDWLVFGVYFVLNNFSDDTCLALKEYQHNPRHTTLDSILPCADLESANATLISAREGLRAFIIEANTNITNVRESDPGNQALQLIPFVCDPFSGPPLYEYTGNCASGTVPLGEVPALLETFKCSSNSSSTQNCLDETTYDSTIAYTTAAQKFVDILPSMESLTNCSFVVDAFSTIVKYQCRPIKSAVRTSWITSVALSTIMVFLMIVCLITLRQWQRNIYQRIVIPHDTASPSTERNLEP